MVVMVLALATEVGGARGHTSLPLLQNQAVVCVCASVCGCVPVCVCVRVGSWLVDSLHTVHGARLVTRQALLHSIANATTAAKK